jgi:hypothetical protein
MFEVRMDEEPKNLLDTSIATLLLREPTHEDKIRIWRNGVWDTHKGCCAGCGGDEHVVVLMTVPLEAGGKLVPENGTTVCRVCQVAAKAIEKAAEGKPNRRPINIWVSKDLYARLNTSLDSGLGFRSMGSLVRFMMGLVVSDPLRFGDLGLYQDPGTDVKINLWVERPVYDSFKSVLADMDMTVTGAIKGLLLMYVSEAEPAFRRN